MVLVPPPGAKELELAVTVMLFAGWLTVTVFLTPAEVTVTVPVLEELFVLAAATILYEEVPVLETDIHEALSETVHPL